MRATHPAAGPKEHRGDLDAAMLPRAGRVVDQGMHERKGRFASCSLKHSLGLPNIKAEASPVPHMLRSSQDPLPQRVLATFFSRAGHKRKGLDRSNACDHYGAWRCSRSRPCTARMR